MTLIIMHVLATPMTDNFFRVFLCVCVRMCVYVCVCVCVCVRVCV